MVVKSGCVTNALFKLNGKNISECSNYVYLGRDINMVSDIQRELSRRKRAAWEIFKKVEDIVKRMKNYEPIFLMRQLFLPECMLQKLGQSRMNDH
ncbi:hypothetical protein DICVIV_07829 [Dictyocaulus viviparus]|uniref:Uncharacterized protein n=1 Tax=Dictyocaulus viviparus TaxID=29172 RepID=A0A0D8XQQ3_DICVI|nr:hypothetical protein DICVIV_07829 [Dictyocaulus viviparus]